MQEIICQGNGRICGIRFIGRRRGSGLQLHLRSCRASWKGAELLTLIFPGFASKLLIRPP